MTWQFLRWSRRINPTYDVVIAAVPILAPPQGYQLRVICLPNMIDASKDVRPTTELNIGCKGKLILADDNGHVIASAIPRTEAIQNIANRQIFVLFRKEPYK